MENKDAMIICNQKVADELIEQDENFKQVICICPWLDEDDAILVVDKAEWNKLVDSGDVYARSEVTGVTKIKEENYDSTD